MATDSVLDRETKDADALGEGHGATVMEFDENAWDQEIADASASQAAANVLEGDALNDSLEDIPVAAMPMADVRSLGDFPEDVPHGSIGAIGGSLDMGSLGDIAVGNSLGGVGRSLGEIDAAPATRQEPEGPRSIAEPGAAFRAIYEQAERALSAFGGGALTFVQRQGSVHPLWRDHEVEEMAQRLQDEELGQTADFGALLRLEMQKEECGVTAVAGIEQALEAGEAEREKAAVFYEELDALRYQIMVWVMDAFVGFSMVGQVLLSEEGDQYQVDSDGNITVTHAINNESITFACPAPPDYVTRGDGEKGHWIRARLASPQIKEADMRDLLEQRGLGNLNKEQLAERVRALFMPRLAIDRHMVDRTDQTEKMKTFCPAYVVGAVDHERVVQHGRFKPGMLLDRWRAADMGGQLKNEGVDNQAVDAFEVALAAFFEESHSVISLSGEGADKIRADMKGRINVTLDSGESIVFPFPEATQPSVWRSHPDNSGAIVVLHREERPYQEARLKALVSSMKEANEAGRKQGIRSFIRMVVPSFRVEVLPVESVKIDEAQMRKERLEDLGKFTRDHYDASVGEVAFKAYELQGLSADEKSAQWQASKARTPEFANSYYDQLQETMRGMQLEELSFYSSDDQQYYGMDAQGNFWIWCEGMMIPVSFPELGQDATGEGRHPYTGSIVRVSLESPIEDPQAIADFMRATPSQRKGFLKAGYGLPQLSITRTDRKGSQSLPRPTRADMQPEAVDTKDFEHSTKGVLLDHSIESLLRQDQPTPEQRRAALQKAKDMVDPRGLDGSQGRCIRVHSLAKGSEVSMQHPFAEDAKITYSLPPEGGRVDIEIFPGSFVSVSVIPPEANYNQLDTTVMEQIERLKDGEVVDILFAAGDYDAEDRPLATTLKDVLPYLSRVEIDASRLGDVILKDGKIVSFQTLWDTKQFDRKLTFQQACDQVYAVLIPGKEGPLTVQLTTNGMNATGDGNGHSGPIEIAMRRMYARAHEAHAKAQERKQKVDPEQDLIARGVVVAFPPGSEQNLDQGEQLLSAALMESLRPRKPKDPLRGLEVSSGTADQISSPYWDRLNIVGVDTVPPNGKPAEVVLSGRHTSRRERRKDHPWLRAFGHFFGKPFTDEEEWDEGRRITQE